MTKIHVGIMGALLITASLAPGVFAQAENVSSTLAGALGVLDSTLDVAVMQNIRGTIENEAAVDVQLEAIESTLRSISALLETDSSGGVIVPTGLPNTGGHL